MGTIQVKDREFEVFLKEEDIQKEIKRVAADINRDYVGKEPLFLCILNGSFMFAADLLKNVSVPCNVSFVKVSSYQGTDICSMSLLHDGEQTVSRPTPERRHALADRIAAPAIP